MFEFSNRDSSEKWPNLGTNNSSCVPVVPRTILFIYPFSRHLKIPYWRFTFSQNHFLLRRDDAPLRLNLMTFYFQVKLVNVSIRFPINEGFDTLDVNLHAQCYARPEQTGNGFGAMGMINSRVDFARWLDSTNFFHESYSQANQTLMTWVVPPAINCDRFWSP